MTSQEFKQILIEERDKLLEQMKKNPHANGLGYLSCLIGYPSTWDINCGYCCIFAENVIERVPEAEEDEPCIPEIHHFEEDGEIFCCHDHMAVLWQGKWYDAECLDGVEDCRNLPIYLNQGKTRIQVLTECGAI